MNAKLRLLILLPIIFVLLACRSLIPTSNPAPTPEPVNKLFSGKPTSTPLPTFTPIPSVTFTPTSLPPTSTSSLPGFTVTPSSGSQAAVQLVIFENLWTIVRDTYVYPDFNGLDWDAIRQEYRQKIAAGLTGEQFYLAMSELIYRLGDDHSFFLDPQQVAQQEAEYQGKHDYVGIGVMVSAVPERHHAVILSVFPGSPAEAAGLQPRDSIISVDGTSILDENGYLRDIVRGPEGTSIDIVVQTPGEEPRNVHITRHRITGDYPVVYKVITTPSGKRIGYILLVTFEDGTVDEQVADALREMTASAPMDGLILDNRMNGGGSSTVLEPMLAFFTGGRLGYFIKHGEQRPFQVTVDDIDGSSKLPLVVLVGSGTASFGEIFAGVLQDVGRAYLIGTTTDGNVEILWRYDFEDGSQLWLANETFKPLNHPTTDWEKTGITPDLQVSGEFDQYALDQDPVVLAGVDYLAGR